MLTFSSLLLTFFGAAIIYLTNKNQKLIVKPLAKFWRFLTIVSWGGALFVWLFLYTLSAAIFLWLFTITIALISIPLLSINADLTSKVVNND